MFVSGHSLLPSLYFFSFFLSPTATTSTPVASLGRVTKPVRTCSLIRKRGDSWTASRKNRRFRNRMPHFYLFSFFSNNWTENCGLLRDSNSDCQASTLTTWPPLRPSMADLLPCWTAVVQITPHFPTGKSFDQRAKRIKLYSWNTWWIISLFNWKQGRVMIKII